MISANPAGRPERVRLSKQAFAEMQKHTERFVLARYPELLQTRIYDRDRRRERVKSNVHEQAMTARTQAPSRKEMLKERLQRVLGQAGTMAELTRLCEAEGMTFYRRGKTVGVIVKEPDGTERKHRLSTLGILARYEATIHRFSERVGEEPEQKTPQAEATRREQALRDTRIEARRRDEPSRAPHCPAEHEKRWETTSGIVLPGDDILFQYLNMNTKQAKELSLPGFLSRLGYVPARSR